MLSEGRETLGYGVLAREKAVCGRLTSRVNGATLHTRASLGVSPFLSEGGAGNGGQEASDPAPTPFLQKGIVFDRKEIVLPSPQRSFEKGNSKPKRANSRAVKDDRTKRDKWLDNCRESELEISILLLDGTTIYCMVLDVDRYDLHVLPSSITTKTINGLNLSGWSVGEDFWLSKSEIMAVKVLSV
jgi:hypothetical protein